MRSYSITASPQLIQDSGHPESIHDSGNPELIHDFGNPQKMHVPPVSCTSKATFQQQADIYFSSVWFLGAGGGWGPRKMSVSYEANTPSHHNIHSSVLKSAIRRFTSTQPHCSLAHINSADKSLWNTVPLVPTNGITSTIDR